MPMLAEIIDAVVGVDTHRDTHHVEIAHPTVAPIATCSISNDTAGYTQLLASSLGVVGVRPPSNPARVRARPQC